MNTHETNDAQVKPDGAAIAPFPLSEDISLAYEWCNASKVFESPGNGEGWRHTCLRLAQEVERQQKELTAERAEAERLRERVAELERIESHLCKELGGEIDARDVNAKYCTEAREENTRLRSELAIRDTEMQVQADLANKHFAELTRLRAVVDVPVNYDAIPTSDVKEVS